jgi:predicted Na+-dependent transporter
MEHSVTIDLTQLLWQLALLSLVPLIVQLMMRMVMDYDEDMVKKWPIKMVGVSVVLMVLWFFTIYSGNFRYGSVNNNWYVTISKVF